MPAYNGTMRDSLGNPLYPLSVAEQILVTVQGQQVPLSTVLSDLSVVPSTITELEYTLQADLDPGDLYTVPEYVVGSKKLQLWLDGIYLHGGATGMWQEYGVNGVKSTVVLINDAIPAHSVLTVRATV